jgi:hypothetical protein
LPELFDYHENLVREGVVAAVRTGTSASLAAAARGMWWINHNSVDDTLTGFQRRRALMTAGLPADVAPTALTYNAPGVGQFFARSSWASDATWLNFTAGPYEESHAHMDQGSFQLYRNGWQTATANIYSVSGLEGVGLNGTPGTEVSNNLRFNKGTRIIQQDNGTNTMTNSVAGGVVRLHGDLTRAYASSASDVRSWTRDLTFQGNTLHVHDAYAVGTGVTATFQLLSPVKPVVNGNGTITAGKLSVAIDPSYRVGLLDMTTLIDPDTGNPRFERGWRIDITNPAGGSFDVDLTANP